MVLTTTPKPEYHKGQPNVYWMFHYYFAQNTEVRANWISLRIANKQTKEVQVP